MDDPAQDMPAATGDGLAENVEPVASPLPEAAADVMAAGTEPADATDVAGALRGLFSSQPMRFPNAYAWLMLFSAMDVMLTWGILHLGGSEVNALANWVIQQFGLNGMIVYKFALVLFFVILCEIVGKLRHRSGMLLSRAGVVIAVFPVVWSLGLLLLRTG